MHIYFAYMCGIKSDLALPELLPWNGTCQIAIRLNNKAISDKKDSIERGWLKFGRDEAVLSIPEIGLFTLHCGQEARLSPTPGVNQRLLRLAILGPVLGGLFFQRGRLVLHASTVEVDGSALLFAGSSGSGKSSIAAALAIRGHNIMGDDLAILDLEEGRCVALPGSPRLRIFSDVAAVLGIKFESQQFLGTLERKQDWIQSRHSVATPLPVRRLYIVALSEHNQVARVNPREGLIDLLRQSYPTRVGKLSDNLHLQQCAQLANQVPILRLTRMEDLSHLTNLAEKVEIDVKKTHL